LDQLPALGVGLIYAPGLEPLLEAHPDLIDVLEVEPQTTWIETDDPERPYLVRDQVLSHLADLPWHKLVHSVGTPVGGSVQAHEAQLPLLREAVQTLGAPWASEHLSFNLTPDFFTGFFLPPRQTEAGIETYVRAVQSLREELGVPLAIETGVTYLRPRGDEIPDGLFMAEVAERADCGILLDLHNVYCNAVNGRQPVERFLEDLPLDRVVEVHLAGGFELEGFWLDAHSGAIPEPLERICRDVIPALPNLKAVIFELFSSFIPSFGLEATREQLERVQALWALRREPESSTVPGAQRAGLPRDLAAVSPPPDPPEWEVALGNLVVGREPTSALESELDSDPGTQLVRGLIKEFRGSMVVSVYRLTSRLLMLALGPDVFRAILEDFWRTAPPQQYAGTEADAFAEYLLGRGLRLPQFESILAFERAALHTLRDGQPRVVRFSVPPLPMLRALADGELLEEPGEPGEYEIEITDEAPIRLAGSDTETVSRTFPFH
jgi:uncharacterized protein (UPF0276 family)